MNCRGTSEHKGADGIRNKPLVVLLNSGQKRVFDGRNEGTK